MSKRDEYVEKMKQQLDEWNAELSKLEARAAEATEPARQKLGPHLTKAKEGYRAGRAKLDEIKDAGEDRFEHLRDEGEHVWKAFRHSVNYFRSQL